MLPAERCDPANADLVKTIRNTLNTKVFPNLPINYISLYARTHEATYGNDMFARFMNAPKRPLNQHVYQGESWRSEFMNCLGLRDRGTAQIFDVHTKSNGTTEEVTFEAVPTFPKVALEASVFGIEGVDSENFAGQIIELPPMSGMCDVAIDDNSQLFYYLQPQEIVQTTRELLRTPIPRNEKRAGSEAKQTATLILSCARALYHSLDQPGFDLDVHAFREDVCQTSITVAAFDVNSDRSKQLKLRLMKETAAELGMKAAEYEIHSNLALIATLIREWMLVAIVIASAIIDPTAPLLETQPAPIVEAKPAPRVKAKRARRVSVDDQCPWYK